MKCGSSNDLFGAGLTVWLTNGEKNKRSLNAHTLSQCVPFRSLQSVRFFLMFLNKSIMLSPRLHLYDLQ